MLTHLKLENFKIWQSTGPIRLAPITLFLGTNSSGKSSLIQSLLVIRQTVQSTEKNLDLNLGDPDQNDSVVLGQFKDVLCRHGMANEIISNQKFGIEFSWKSIKNELQVTFSAHYRAGNSGSAEIDYLHVGSEHDGFTVKRVKPLVYRLQLSSERKARRQSTEFRPQLSFTFSKSVISELKDKGQKIEELGNQLIDELAKVIYLGPVRRLAQRDYIWSGRLPTNIEDDGFKAIDILIADFLMYKNSKKINVHLTGESIFRNTELTLQKMGLATGLEIRQIGGSNRYELFVINGEDKSNLKDVGVGVAQVLPIVVAAYFAQPNHVVIVEEPESHLHPLAQRELANLFAEVSENRNVQFIVETHSEHLFRRMQTLIAKNEDPSFKPAMYFIDRLSNNAILKPLEVDEYGRVMNWPPSFFGDSLGETREQTALFLKKAKQKRIENGTISN